eukprot:4136804-Amphidinium_carterae.1
MPLRWVTNGIFVTAEKKTGDNVAPSAPLFLRSDTDANRTILEALLKDPMKVSVANALDPKFSTMS